MHWLDINRYPTSKDLRWFGGLLIPFSGVLAWLFLRKGWEWELIGPVAAAGIVVGIVGLIAPQRIRRVYVGWMLAVTPISWVVTNIVLGLVFFAVVWPISLLIRAKQRNVLKLRFEKDQPTYWEARPKQQDPRRYFRQY